MIRQIEKLRGDHAVEAFDCGYQELNRFLQKHALASQYSGGAQTYVGLVDQTVVGYHSLAVGSVEYGQASERMKRGLGKHSVPIMILARLAVDVRWQKQGIGAALLKDAMLRTIQAADIGGIRALVVHAQDDVAKGFYEHFDFIPSLSDPLHLHILLKDLRRTVS
ncbi:MAG TPA: GNAT family N-acetyltransferase [Nitrospira sp.]|nr:GNAT family N-acetyltransferase [Nitrospira sp.]